jgi:hypothetical protein
MNRKPLDTDFFVDVPNVGRFRFARRTFGDRIRIRSEYMRLTGGFGEGDLDLSVMGMVTAMHLVLCVTAPSGWEDIESMDSAADPDGLDKKLMDLYAAVKEKEDSFRSQPGTGGQGAGQGDGANAGAVVPAPVSAVASGSSVPGTDARGHGR